MDAKQVIADYDALIERAKEILEPYVGYYAHVREERCARLTIEGDEATLSWPDIEYAYGDSSLEVESKSFPAHLLTMPPAEFAAWKEEQISKGKAAQLASDAARAEQRKRDELATLAALKQKYGQ